MKTIHIALIALLAIPATSKAQKLVDSRDQAEGWYLPVQGIVTLGGQKAKDLDVQVYKGNELLSEITAKKGKFTVDLDLGSTYSVIVSKDGFEPKMVQIDTHVPDQLVEYPAYACYLNLEPSDKFSHADPFYLDFPIAVVGWNKDMQGFYHSKTYLADIQAKVALLEAQVMPQ